jgi:hypothetical protein
MIITNLIGGLGNQMFQYAVARRLGHRHRTIVKLDISGFETYKLHKFSLGGFNIQADVAIGEDLKSMGIRKPSLLENYLRLACRCPVKPSPNHIFEKLPFIFNPDILALPDGVYLDGYWQNEKYFIEITDIIRREFTVKTPQAGKDKEMAEEILSCESVSLHIRRGDYVSNPLTHSIHGICDLDYYSRGIAHVVDRIRNPRLFVFSDEPEWARSNLVSHCPITLVSHNGPEKNYEDLRMMSQCRHHIIANSSFSWWGAWLNPSPSKIVISPARWMRKEEMKTDDLLPEGWIRM